jgi:peptidoglycan/xylan/chitin deacetylase (PgdA/CDA1 family)
VATQTGQALRFSWFLRMDPQIAETYGDPAWFVKQHTDLVQEWQARGDDIGLHPHTYRWDATRGAWLIERVDQKWVDQCIRTSFAAFEAVFHRPSYIYRMGDRSLSNASLALAEALGARIDLSVEPGYVESPGIFRHELQTGGLPDYSRAPQWPYQPSPADFLRPDPTRARRIWILPVSTWQVTRLLQLPRRLYFELRTLRHKPVPDDLKLQSTMTLSLALPPRLFRRIVNDLLHRAGRPYLISMDRSDIGTTPHKLERIARNVSALLSHPLADRFVFTRSQEALDVLGCTTRSSDAAA